jgi:uncharacterized LabA/DUF88 family protein
MNESSSKSSLLRHPQQRVGIFIDTQNLYHSARSNFNSNVNYKNLVESAVSGRKLLRAFAYVIKSDTSDESKFFDALIELGIETRVKDLQIFYSGEKKADWDVGIAMDIVRLSEKIDVVVLVSGDGDFLEVFRYCKSRGIRAELMAFKKTTSAKLLDEADDFIDLGGENGRYLIPQGKTARTGFGRPNPRPDAAPRPAAGAHRTAESQRPAPVLPRSNAASRSTPAAPAPQKPLARWLMRKKP